MQCHLTYESMLKLQQGDGSVMVEERLPTANLIPEIRAHMQGVSDRLVEGLKVRGFVSANQLVYEGPSRINPPAIPVYLPDSVPNFREKTLEAHQFILHLLKEKGFTLIAEEKLDEFGDPELSKTKTSMGHGQRTTPVDSVEPYEEMVRRRFKHVKGSSSFYEEVGKLVQRAEGYNPSEALFVHSEHPLVARVRLQSQLHRPGPHIRVEFMHLGPTPKTGSTAMREETPLRDFHRQISDRIGEEEN